MLELDELVDLDKHRKDLIHNVKMSVYEWINENFPDELKRCRVKVEHYSILLMPVSRLDDDVIKCFEDDFSLTLVRLMESKVENFCDLDYIYPEGCFVDLKYVFKSSGGIY